MDIPSEFLDCSPLKCLLTLLNMGAEITNAHEEISVMLNGIRQYSLEVTRCDGCYNIQGYGQDALDLYNTVTTLHYRKALAKIIAKY